MTYDDLRHDVQALSGPDLYEAVALEVLGWEVHERTVPSDAMAWDAGVTHRRWRAPIGDPEDMERPWGLLQTATGQPDFSTPGNAWYVVRWVMDHWEVLGFEVTEHWQGALGVIRPHSCRWPVEVVTGEWPLRASVDPREVPDEDMELAVCWAICRAALVMARVAATTEDDR